MIYICLMTFQNYSMTSTLLENNTNCKVSFSDSKFYEVLFCTVYLYTKTSIRVTNIDMFPKCELSENSEIKL
ncbi:hypothetical protein T4A_1098 [Trichinella pseudospiralis]|uniref:Uncharacterized protein n=1 Tax=Trichinella pseudospiralis TaxID=6337 RepID=A0A0V1JPI9_TRIPS|nr:hypothetical protein T4A_1098 [Trichinella pseudospiralis]KRZ36863.1 hypothetical protein T4C_6090 [Trichinella pseudospiralis]